MKCIILVAGYATRLYPLTKDKPKSLLEVGGKEILAHILEKIQKVDRMDEIYIVSNHRFYDQFVDWVKEYPYPKRIMVLDDGTTSNDDRLGAIADLQYAIDKYDITEDIMVLAGDNLFDFELTDFERYYQEVQADCITTHELDSIKELQRTGVIERDPQGRVVSFEEKPKEPKSNLAVPPFYIYRADTIPLIKKYLEEGNNPDAPGNFVPWLIRHKEVYAYQFEGYRYDIGTLESYEEVQRCFAAKKISKCASHLTY